MADEMVRKWELEAGQMRGRPLTKEETAAIGEEMLKGKLHPGLAKRPMKNALRTAIDSVRPGKTQRPD